MKKRRRRKKKEGGHRENPEVGIATLPFKGALFPGATWVRWRFKREDRGENEC